MAKRWRIHAHDADRIAALERAAGIPPVVAHLLLCRGVADTAAAKSFLDPKLADLRDPELLPGCANAAEIVHAAIRDRKRICVYGDYDVDGVTGTALLWQCLKLLGAEASYYIPHRVEEGYGLNAEAIRAKAAEKFGLLISVDCGIARSPASWASKRSSPTITSSARRCPRRRRSSIRACPAAAILSAG
jgi:single-stranded-DNA-specific exonuclease